MKANLLRTGLPASLALAAMVFTACSPRSPSPATSSTVTVEARSEQSATAAPAASRAAAEFDRLFIDMMVPHHEGAVEMAGIARSRVEHEELKRLLADIQRTQAAEVTEMRRWRQEWYGSGATPPMGQMPMLPAMSASGGTPDTMNMAAEVVRLRNAPEPFDRAFIDAMIPHHRSAVEAARVAEQQATRPQVRELALKIVESQQREIDQLRQWRQAWYGSAEPSADSASPDGKGTPMEPAEKPADDPHGGH